MLPVRPGASDDLYIFNYILLKLAARCNIACSYCYWFRDKSVFEKPAILTEAAEDAFCEKLARHVMRHDVERFFILFHGGEPLLIGKARFDLFCRKLRLIEERLGFHLQLAVTTNGLLIDSDWAQIFRQHQVRVTLSIDGPQPVHDQFRLDFKGRGTFEGVLAGLHALRENGLEPGVLAVCNPAVDPKVICDFFADELKLLAFDILVPDANHERRPASIAAYYQRLFDLWHDVYAPRGIQIRYIESVVKGLLGIDSHSESIGYGPTSTFTMLTDGSLEPLDVLRTAGYRATQTEYNVFDHELQDIQNDPLWREVRDASLNLAPACQQCVYHQACGGGHIASRWSKANRYNNPSVYCEDIKEIMRHAWQRMAPELYIQLPEGPIPLLNAVHPSFEGEYDDRDRSPAS